MLSLLDFMERATTGPIISENEFNMGFLIPNVRKIVREYGIRYDPGNPVPSDDGFADRLFEGAIEFLAKTGVYCDATNRIIHLDRREIVKTIENLPKAGTFGEGPERRLFKSRRPEDKNPPWCHVGAGIVASKEEIALAQVEGYGSIPEACSTRKKIAAKCRRIGRELDGMMGNPRPPKGFTPTIKQRSPPAVYLVNGR